VDALDEKNSGDYVFLCTLKLAVRNVMYNAKHQQRSVFHAISGAALGLRHGVRLDGVAVARRRAAAGE
jgi:hypothetical protein